MQQFGGSSPNVAQVEWLDYGGPAIYQPIYNGGSYYTYERTVSITSGKMDLGIYVDSRGNTSTQIDRAELRLVSDDPVIYVNGEACLTSQRLTIYQMDTNCSQSFSCHRE
jgi:hypothetical protein